MISKDMLIIDLLRRFPQAKEVLKEHGMACVDCMGSIQETVEKGAEVHGLDLDALLTDLRQTILKIG